MTISHRFRAGGPILYVIAALLVLVAAAGWSLRWAVTHAEWFHGPLTAAVAARWEQPVRVGAYSGRMVGWQPRVELHDVSIGSGDTRVSLPTLVVSLSLWDSLLAGEPHIQRAVAEGATLTLVRRSGGGLAPAFGEPLSLHDLPARLALRDGTVRLVDATGGRTRVFTGVNAALRRETDGVRVAVRARAPGVASGEFRFSYRGDLAAGSGVTHLQVDALRLAVLAPWLPDALKLQKLVGEVDAQAWLHHADGRLQSLQTRFAGNSVRFRGMVLTSLSGRARWRADDNGGRLTLRGWHWRTEQDSGKLSALALAYRDGAWRAAAPRLKVASLRALALALPTLSDDFRERLSTLRGQGELRGVRIGVAGADWRVALSFHGIATKKARGYWPGVSGVGGTLVAADRGGHFSIEALRGAMSLPALFRRPLPYNRLTLTGSWRRREDGLWRVAVPAIQLDSPHGQANGRAAVWFGLSGGPFLDVAAELDEGDGRYASRYYPTGIMPDELVAWLDQAIGGGRVPHAEMLLYGPAAPFPYRDGEGHFRVRGRAEDVPFSFHPDWPDIKAVSGEVDFENEGMTIRADGGHIAGVRMTDVEARIPELEHAPVLALGITGTGPANDMLDFLRASPVTAQAPPQLDDLKISGSHPLTVTLSIPIEAVEKTRVSGTVTLADADIALAGWSRSLESVRGAVHFSERGLAWKDLHGRFGGAAWVSDARTGERSEGARIVVDANLRAAAAELLADRPAVTARSRGKTRWQVAINAPGFPPAGDDAPAALQLTSDLRGLAVDLPAPWGKTADKTLDMTLSTRLGSDGLTAPLRLHWGDKADLRMRVSTDGLRALAVGVGGVAAPPLPETATTVLVGQIAGLPPGLPVGQRTTFPAGIPPLSRLHLELATLTFGGYRLDATTIDAQRQDQEWRVTLAGKDVAGAVDMPVERGQSPVAIRLDRLHLHADAADAGNARGSVKASWLPSMTTRVQALQVDERELGAFMMRLERSGDQLRLERLKLSNPSLTLTARGQGNGPNGARLHVSAEAGDVGAALVRLGYAWVLSGGQGTAQADLRWPGALSDPALAALDGSVRFQIDDGVLPAIKPGAGRLLGLLSIAALPRRLLLDFSDVTEKGLTFSRLKANLTLEDGVLKPETFFLEGPAGRVDIAGPVNLNTRRLEQTVTVTPKVSSALPLIGGLAGGPQGAILLFLAQRLFGSGVDRLTRYSYRVSGPIEDPQVEPLELEHTGKGQEIHDDEGPSFGH